MAVRRKFTGVYSDHDRRRHHVSLTLPLGGDGKAMGTQCGVHQYGTLAAAGVGLDGIMGFGRSNFSLISQLSKSGLVQKSFSHCLDSDFGGGIFIIGRVKHPIVKTTPLTKNRDHYIVNMLAIEVDKYILELGSGKGMETIIDSGSTLAYLPEEIYEIILNKILSNHQHRGFYSVKALRCFHYNGSSVDVDFPSVTLHFDSSLQFLVYPREYLIHYQLHSCCLGWKSSRSLAKELQNIALLGDMVLSNKFVHYDIENEAIGWKDYDCFSLIRV